MQRDAKSYEFWTLLQNDEVVSTSEERLEIIENTNLAITIVDIHDPSSLAGGKVERKIHKEKYKSQQENCRKEEGVIFLKSPTHFLGI